MISTDKSESWKRELVFVDNTDLLGAIQKGRSSNPRFYRMCRRIAGLFLAGNIELIVKYINSADHPADELSALYPSS